MDSHVHVENCNQTFKQGIVLKLNYSFFGPTIHHVILLLVNLSYISNKRVGEDPIFKARVIDSHENN